MTVDELHEYVTKQFTDLRSKVERIDHVLGNNGNVLNLFVAQEEKLKNNILYLLLKAAMVLENDKSLSVEYLYRCMEKLESLRSSLRKRILDLNGEVPVFGTDSPGSSDGNEG